MNDEENVKRFLQTVYSPVVASFGFKERLQRTLAHMAAAEKSPRPLWKSANLWVYVAGVIILADICYGVWLGQVVVLSATLP